MTNVIYALYAIGLFTGVATLVAVIVYRMVKGWLWLNEGKALYV